MKREKHVVRLTFKLSTVFALLLAQVQGQELHLPMSKAGVQQYRGAFYFFGLSSVQTKATLVIYKADSTLRITDSIQIALGKKSSSDYSRLLSDTLHGQLQVYLQRSDGLAGQIVRPKADLSAFELISNIDSPRMNQVSKFSTKKYVTETNVYDISSTSDSTGQQYYLTKYKRISAEGNYDYTKDWQFPFEKKDISDLQIVFEDEKHVFVYVYRASTSGPTQWLLRLSASQGRLQKASRIKGLGNEFYRLGLAVQNKKTKELLIVGQVSSQQVLPKFKNTCAVWLCRIDTSGEAQDLKTHRYLLQPYTKTSKALPNYFLNFESLKINENDRYDLTVDLYESIGASCKRFTGSQKLLFDGRMESAELTGAGLLGQVEIATYYTSTDKLDRNGKICLKMRQHLL